MSPVAPVQAVNSATAVGATAGAATSAAPSQASFERFNAAYEAAASRSSIQNTDSNGIGALVGPLLNLNHHSSKLAEAADVSGASDLRPGELLNLTMRSHEFLFHCQLVSNVANRSSDGLQQLFRQQS